MDESLTLWQRNKELWLFPAVLESWLGKVRFSRIGLKLAETFPKGFRWQHEAVVALVFELDEAQAESWYRGQGIHPDTPRAR